MENRLNEINQIFANIFHEKKQIISTSKYKVAGYSFIQTLVLLLILFSNYRIGFLNLSYHFGFLNRMMTINSPLQYLFKHTRQPVSTQNNPLLSDLSASLQILCAQNAPISRILVNEILSNFVGFFCPGNGIG